jgi:high-affinity iron transporter
MAAFLLSLREGIEAALIVSILLSALRRSAARTGPLWIGVTAAASVSILLAVGLSWLGRSLTGRTEAVFEGLMLLVAAAVLTWMIFWMQSRSRSLRAHLVGQVERSLTDSPAAAGHSSAGALQPAGWALFTVAFVAVVREGLELALFLTAAVFATSPGQTLAGALLGLALAAALGALLFAGTVRLSLARFFLVTSLLLIIFAAGMTARGVHELVEAGVLPGIIQPVWNSASIVSEQSLLGQLLAALFGYSSDPSLTEALAYLGYFVVIALGLGWRRARLAYLGHTTA